MPRPLKVFRTAVGFRDAYVAAPSKAAALRAWGTDKDLFARGAAELVTDAALTGDALRKPGEVVYRTRGGLEEQVAALGKPLKRKAGRKAAESEPSKAKPARKLPPAQPRPSRAELEAAEAKIAALQQERDHADADLRRRESALVVERKTIKARFAKQLDALQRKLEQARKTYEAALRKWEP